MSVSFTNETNSIGKKSNNMKRIQIHVVEAHGLGGKSIRSPPAYVTIESPGVGTLHQTGTVGKGKSLVWHENTRIVELKPTAGIKFTVKRQSLWPIANNVLGSTDTYDLGRLIEMQGKNDKETCITLSLKPPGAGKSPSPSLVVNIRDLDTTEKMQQLKEYAAYSAGLSRKGKQRDSDCSTISTTDQSSTSASSLDLPRTPMTASSFSSSFSVASAPAASSSFHQLPAMSSSTPHLTPLSPAITAEAVAATSVMSAALASPSTASSTSPSLSLSNTKSKHSSISSSKGKVPPPLPLDAICEELRQISTV